MRDMLNRLRNISFQLPLQNCLRQHCPLSLFHTLTIQSHTHVHRISQPSLNSNNNRSPFPLAKCTVLDNIRTLNLANVCSDAQSASLIPRKMLSRGISLDFQTQPSSHLMLSLQRIFLRRLEGCCMQSSLWPGDERSCQPYT